MKITAISAQVRNPDRVNVSVDGKYRFSLDIAQLTDLGVKVGRDYSDAELARLEEEGQFGKLYARALEYSLSRPHSIKEVRDYLWRKTLTTRKQLKQRRRDGSIEYKTVEKPGYAPQLAERVLARLIDRGHLNDTEFAGWWVDNRHLTKGASRRKLQSELQTKGVASDTIAEVLAESERDDRSELAKIIAKKRARYPDEQKLKQYLARQGFAFDDINQALASQSELD